MFDQVWLPQIDQALCAGCDDCVAVCPSGVLAVAEDKAVIVEPAA